MKIEYKIIKMGDEFAEEFEDVIEKHLNGMDRWELAGGVSFDGGYFVQALVRKTEMNIGR